MQKQLVHYHENKLPARVVAPIAVADALKRCNIVTWTMQLPDKPVVMRHCKKVRLGCQHNNSPLAHFQHQCDVDLLPEFSASVC